MSSITEGATVKCDRHGESPDGLVDVLRDLLHELQRRDYQVAVNRVQAAEMFGLSPTSDTFRSIEKRLRRRQPSGVGGKVLYSTQSIREYMGDLPAPASAKRGGR